MKSFNFSRNNKIVAWLYKHDYLMHDDTFCSFTRRAIVLTIAFGLTLATGIAFVSLELISIWKLISWAFFGGTYDSILWAAPATVAIVGAVYLWVIWKFKSMNDRDLRRMNGEPEPEPSKILQIARAVHERTCFKINITD